MSTFLFKYSVFGPINTVRLGMSLGIDILPENSKHCNFDCIYCECGVKGNQNEAPKLLSVERITEDLLLRVQILLDRNISIDTLTFAGNGEPTIHPDFDEIVLSVKNIRDTFLPEAKIALLNNSTLLHKPIVKKGTEELDYTICKLDAGSEEMWGRINRPKQNVKFEEIISNLCNQSDSLIIQTLFLTGEHNGVLIDNTSEKELKAYFERLKEIKPQHVMIYSVDKDSPAKQLVEVSKAKLYEIAKQINELGFTVSVA